MEEKQLDFLNSRAEEKTKVEFKIISAKKLENLVLSYKQIVVLLEALYNYKLEIEKLDGKHDEAEARHKYKLNEIDTLFKYLEHGIRYDFEGAVNKCINKLGNKKDDDPGMETMNWLAK